MKVYQPGTKGKRTLFVTPAHKFPATHFLNDSGTPKIFSIVFIDGEAEVDDQLGQYLLDEDIAKSSPIVLFR